MLVVFLILLFIVIFIALKSIKIVQEAHVYIIERLGKFHKVAESGLTIIVPFIDKVAADVSLKKQIMDIKPQEVITQDNVTIAIDTVVFYQITDPVKSVYEIESLMLGIQNLAISSMRDVIGKMQLDETFSSREKINNKLRITLDEATDTWGCKIEKVEIQQISIPKDIKDSMEKQMNAERTKRAEVLAAEGKKQAAITIAEGEKESAILNAQAEREVAITKAEGEAQAVRTIAEAEAQKIKMTYGAIKESAPDEKLVQLKSLESLIEFSKGDANKVFIPYGASDVLSSIGAAVEIAKDNKTTKLIKNNTENMSKEQNIETK